MIMLRLGLMALLFEVNHCMNTVFYNEYLLVQLLHNIQSTIGLLFVSIQPHLTKTSVVLLPLLKLVTFFRITRHLPQLRLQNLLL